MRIINIIGLVHFLKLYQKYNSILSLIIFLNGILYHSNENNMYLRFNDCIFNFITCFYIFYHYFQKFKYHVYISLSIYLFNLYMYDYCHYITRDISDFIHVIGVQYVLSVALEKYIKIEK
jgi:hypothetical protein